MDHTDLRNRDATPLLGKKVFLLDMDGTLYNEERLFPGVVPFLSFLKANGIRYFFLTNNSSKGRAEYIAKLARLGINAKPEEIIISTHIAANYINRHYPHEKTYVVGTASCVAELKVMGVNVVNDIIEDAKVVLVANDTELNFKKLHDASYLLTHGAHFIATNVDRACPSSFGYVPDCGGICRMLAYATKRIPRYMGKPKREIVNFVHDITEAEPREIVMVGDRLYTDMAMATKYGMTSLLVLSGEAKYEEIKKFKAPIDYVFQDINALWEALR